MDKALIFLLPVATAFTAWFTAWAMLYFVLYPISPIKFLGFTLQGFLLKNQQDIAEKVGEGIAKELAAQDISSLLADENALKGVYPLIEQHLDNFLRIKLKEKMPIISAFIGNNTIEKLKDGMMEEITVLLPEVITKYAGNILTNPAVKTKITQSIATYPAEKIKANLAPILKQAMSKLPIMFALVGLVIGAVVAVIMYAFT